VGLRLGGACRNRDLHSCRCHRRARMAYEQHASETADLAKSTKEDVALARTAIEADVRPVLIAVPRSEFVHPMGMNYDIQIPGGGVRGNPDRAVVYVQDVDERLFVSVPARNEGAGIAFLRSGVLDWQGADLPGVITSEQVPPQAFTRASFGLPAPSLHAVNEAGSLSVKITYTDLAGNIWASKFTVEPTPEIGAHDWKVGGFELSHEGSNRSRHLWHCLKAAPLQPFSPALGARRQAR
jgi:hypothetical protein